MEKVLLIGVNTAKSTAVFAEEIEECKRLCEACNYEVAEVIIQNLDTVDRQTCVGSGKLLEINECCENLEIENIVFYNNLSPLQISNIATICNCDVFDRTGLILTIFSIRARTREAQIQTEMARLRYELPRLIYSDNHGDQQRGGSGVKNRGKGETSLELKRREVERRISNLKKELKALQTQTNIQKAQRIKSNLPMVALIGYTNAGKSSLMNALLKKNHSQEEKQVFEKDMLFATLDTSVRRVQFTSGKEFLLFDTVGFVSNLPLDLIEAFKSTLSAIKEADCLVQVFDSSSTQIEIHEIATMDVLKKIEANHLPILNVYNKCDLINEQTKNDGIYVSTKTNEGIDELLNRIEAMVYPTTEELECIIPYEDLSIIQMLKQTSTIEFLKDEDKGRRIRVICSKEVAEKIVKYCVGEENE